jgi:mRNA interferase MazF
MSIFRGEVYYADLGGKLDAQAEKNSEQAGDRPVVILSINRIHNSNLGIAIVVPGTRGSNRSKDFPTNARVAVSESGLAEESVFLGFQVRAIDIKKLRRRAGELNAEALKRVEVAVAFCLGMQS